MKPTVMTNYQKIVVLETKMNILLGGMFLTFITSVFNILLSK